MLLSFLCAYSIIKINSMPLNYVKVSIFTLMYGVLLIALGSINPIIKITALCIALIELSHRLFKIELMRAVVSSALAYFMIAIGDTASLLILNSFMKISMNSMQNDPKYVCLVCLIIFIVVLLSANLIRGVNNLLLISKTSDIKGNVISFIYIIMTLCFLGLNAYIYKYIPRSINRTYVYFLVFTSVAFIVLNLSVLFINKRYLVQRLEYEQLKVYTDVTDQLIGDFRKFRHDYLNVIRSINGYIEDKDINGLNSFINDEVIPESRSIEESNMLPLQKIKNPGIRGIITSKVLKAEGLGVSVTIEIKDDIGELPMRTIDAIRMFGIILDNAVEAAVESETKLLKIGMMSDEGYVVSVVSNTYAKIPNVKKIYEKGFSTKGEGRGIGLSNLNEIIDQLQDKIILNTFIEKDMFIQELNFKIA